jgi:hypothetical protein
MQISEIINEILDVTMGFRKFIAFLCVFTVGVVFRLKGLIDGGQAVDLLKNTFTAFVAVNGVEHFTSMVKAHINSKSLLNAVNASTAKKEEG